VATILTETLKHYQAGFNPVQEDGIIPMQPHLFETEKDAVEQSPNAACPYSCHHVVVGNHFIPVLYTTW
jgi:hypothetical protein